MRFDKASAAGSWRISSLPARFTKQSALPVRQNVPSTITVTEDGKILKRTKKAITGICPLIAFLLFML